jgi:hypothetical protein
LKRETTIHRLNKFGNRTVCGVNIFRGSGLVKTHKTYKGVTCENCKGVRAKQIRLDKAAKDKRYMKRVSKSKIGTATTPLQASVAHRIGGEW